jgi:hypothetical protein
MQLVRNGTALQVDLKIRRQPDPTISRARLVGAMPEYNISLMGLCLPDLTAITLQAPKRICNLYEDCSNALTIVLIFPCGEPPLEFVSLGY